ncbi:hypothetical protein [Ferrimonas sediminum]|uniref:hypothetical protein n=1 Tax=Ferrimonas sediminum TaxID=718193 RepID=UPI000B8695E6|nr:hypothetical protein [Ferrimonas sediminum]
MKKWEFLYDDKNRGTNISYWVHIGVDEESKGYWSCDEYIPPFPAKVPGKGYPLLLVVVQGWSFSFASMVELTHCIDVLSQKNLPTTMALSKQRGTSAGPNSHWLSRFPSKFKPWRKRERLVTVFKKVRAEIARESINF